MSNCFSLIICVIYNSASEVSEDLDCEADLQAKSEEEPKLEKSKDTTVMSSGDVDTKKHDSGTGQDLPNATENAVIDLPTSTANSLDNGDRHEDKTMVGEKDVENHKLSVSQQSVSQENKDGKEKDKEKCKFVLI